MAGATEGIERRPLLAIAISPGVGVGFATADRRWAAMTPGPAAAIFEAQADTDARIVWWGDETARQLAVAGIALDRGWSVLAVHRLLNGGWRTSIGEVWATLHDVPLETLPSLGQLDLLDPQVDEGTDPENPVRPDGHLRPEWTGGGWADSGARLEAWAALALEAATLQHRLVVERSPRALSTARSESAAELLCAELATAGLPIDTGEAERIIASAAGRRTSTYAEEDVERAKRDAAVIDALTVRRSVNLRNPADVKAMLRSEGIDVADTRAWRLEELRGTHPVIDELLRWRKDERIATTYGYRWLDEHVDDGRLRGGWSSSDGAAGRMTASAGLHNLPTEMRSAVAAPAGRVLVRADLGQVEPRVLAAVSGDPALIAATRADDLYQTIAGRLAVDREVAKLAVLGAMYGGTTGQSAHALPGLRQHYPVAMALLETAAEDGRQGQDVFTIGGRRIRLGRSPAPDGDADEQGSTDQSATDRNLDRARSAAEARGRFARNALIQGAAAEYFKVWAITVRRRARALDAAIVLCLHDELLVDAPRERGPEVARLVEAAVDEAAHYWSPEPDVRFVADVSIVTRWSEAKD